MKTVVAAPTWWQHQKHQLSKTGQKPLALNWQTLVFQPQKGSSKGKGTTMSESSVGKTEGVAESTAIAAKPDCPYKETLARFGLHSAGAALGLKTTLKFLDESHRITKCSDDLSSHVKFDFYFNEIKTALRSTDPEFKEVVRQLWGLLRQHLEGIYRNLVVLYLNANQFTNIAEEVEKACTAADERVDEIVKKLETEAKKRYPNGFPDPTKSPMKLFVFVSPYFHENSSTFFVLARHQQEAVCQLKSKCEYSRFEEDIARQQLAGSFYVEEEKKRIGEKLESMLDSPQVFEIIQGDPRVFGVICGRGARARFEVL